MSLINDAIKQANKANKSRPQATAPTGTPTAGMHEAAPSRPASSGSMMSVLLLCGIVAFVLLGGTLLFLALRNRTVADAHGPSAPAPAPAGNLSREPPAVGSPPATEPVAAVVSSPESNDPAPEVRPGPVVVAQPAAPVAPVPSAFPELKLQGIYYRIDRPSVMINGKTLEIGDFVADAQVIQIDRKEVTVEFAGEQRVLCLQ